MDRRDLARYLIVVLVAIASLFATLRSAGAGEPAGRTARTRTILGSARPAAGRWRPRLVGAIGGVALAATLLAPSVGRSQVPGAEDPRLRLELPSYVASVVVQRRPDGTVDREWGWIGRYSGTLYKGRFPQPHEVGDYELVTMTDYLNAKIDRLPIPR